MYFSSVLLVGFSAAFTISMSGSAQFGIKWDQGGRVFRSLIIVFNGMLGAFDLGDYEHWVALMMFILFAMIMVVVMLNLLIAMMGSSYEDVKAQAEKETLKLRAQVVLDMERGLSPVQVESNPKWFPSYVQVLEPAKLAAETQATS